MINAAYETRVIVIPYKPRDIFKSFHARKQRWACLVAHRRAGKTVACINDIIKRAISEGKSDGRYAYIAPYYSQVKRIAWDYLLRYSAPVRVSANQAELWIELINGARIMLFGADNPDSLRGLYLDGVILDEYADMRPRVWGEVIRPFLVDRQGWAVFIGTPKGHNVFYDTARTAEVSPDWYSQTIRASTSGIISDNELQDARANMSPDQYDQEFECSFEAAILGAYYANELRDLIDQGRLGQVPYDPSVPVFTAWDLGLHDDTAIWFYQVLRGEIHVVDYYAASGLLIEDYAREINSRGYVYGKHYLPHDAVPKTLASGGKSIMEQLAPLVGGPGKISIVPSLSVQDGIQAARVALGRCWFDRAKTGDAVETLKQYQRSWDETKKVFRDKPLHDHTSHCADAFRMLALSWREPRIEQPTPPPAWPVASSNGKMVTIPLDDLWKDTKRRQERY